MWYLIRGMQAFSAKGQKFRINSISSIQARDIFVTYSEQGTEQLISPFAVCTVSTLLWVTHHWHPSCARPSVIKFAWTELRKHLSAKWDTISISVHWRVETAQKSINAETGTRERPPPWSWKPFRFWMRNGSSKFASFCPDLNLK